VLEISRAERLERLKVLCKTCVIQARVPNHESTGRNESAQGNEREKQVPTSLKIGYFGEFVDRDVRAQQFDPALGYGRGQDFVRLRIINQGIDRVGIQHDTGWHI